MKAHKIQRANNAENIREELYVPELKIAYCAVSSNLQSDLVYFESVHEDNMSSLMLKDLTGVVNNKIPKRKGYSVWSKGIVDVDENYIKSLEEKISELGQSEHCGADEKPSRLFNLIVCQSEKSLNIC